MSMLGRIGTLVAKDVRLEGRTRHTAGMMFVLALLIVVVLSLGAAGRPAGAGSSALWVAFMFSGILCFERAMRVEREDDALAAVRLSLASGAEIFAAKLAFNLIAMTALGAVLIPVAAVFLGLSVRAPVAPSLAVAAMSIVGLSGVGTLFAAAGSARSSGGLVGLLVLPLTLPLVIAAVRTLESPTPGLGIGILAAFDVIVLTVGWLAYEFLLEG